MLLPFFIIFSPSPPVLNAISFEALKRTRGEFEKPRSLIAAFMHNYLREFVDYKFVHNKLSETDLARLQKAIEGYKRIHLSIKEAEKKAQKKQEQLLSGKALYSADSMKEVSEKGEYKGQVANWRKAIDITLKSIRDFEAAEVSLRYFNDFLSEYGLNFDSLMSIHPKMQDFEYQLNIIELMLNHKNQAIFTVEMQRDIEPCLPATILNILKQKKIEIEEKKQEFITDEKNKIHELLHDQAVALRNSLEL